MTRLAFVISDMGMGGAQRVVSSLTATLVNSGHAVDIVTLAGPTVKSFFFLPSSVKIHPLDALGHSSGLGANFNRIKLLRRALTAIKPDCIVSFQTETNCTVLLAMVGTKIPVIVSERSDPYIHPQAKIWRLIRRVIYPLATGAVFQTQHAAGFFEGVVKNKTVIFNPVYTDKHLDAVTVTDGPFILGVGRLSQEKGFHDLITAHAQVKKSCADLKLVLLGDGPERDTLENQARALGTEKDVVFAGKQKNTEPYYRAALAFALPSQFEGLPNALLEAMNAGCAVISTPLFAAAPEIINHGKNGLIAASGTPQALAKEIENIYKNPDLRASLGRGAQAGSFRFSPDSILDEWIDFLRTTSPGLRPLSNL